MIRAQEPLSVLIAIVVAIVSIGCFTYVFVVERLVPLSNEVATTTVVPMDTSGWQTYDNAQYGFKLEYPVGWAVSTNGLDGETPFIALGNPLEGLKTYSLDIFIENNSSSLSSGEYAHAVINAARATDAANAKNGPAPQTAPKYDRGEVLTVGGYPAYELYNVFEFDHNAERIYVTQGSEALRFDFPVAKENPNISLPVINNGIVHEIINTLIFTK